MMFFMVLVALVGLGLGMFQLFHLQKELAELREVSWHVDCGALEARGGHTALSQCRGPRGPQSCTVLCNPFFLSQKWIVLDIFFDRELQVAPMRKRNIFCWGKKGSRP